MSESREHHSPSERQEDTVRQEEGHGPQGHVPNDPNVVVYPAYVPGSMDQGSTAHNEMQLHVPGSMEALGYQGYQGPAYAAPPYGMYPPGYTYYPDMSLRPAYPGDQSMYAPLVPGHPRPAAPPETRPPKRPRAKRRGPKRPLSAYMFYCSSHRAQVMREFPEHKFAEVGRVLGERWLQLSEEQKQPYYRLNEDDRERYRTAVQELSDLSEDSDVPVEKEKKKRRPRREAPKRALTAYIFFAQDERPRVRTEFPDASFADVARILGERWNAISAEERRPYERKCAEDKSRFFEEKQRMQERQEQERQGQALGPPMGPSMGQPLGVGDPRAGDPRMGMGMGMGMGIGMGGAGMGAGAGVGGAPMGGAPMGYYGGVAMPGAMPGVGVVFPHYDARDAQPAGADGPGAEQGRGGGGRGGADGPREEYPMELPPYGAYPAYDPKMGFPGVPAPMVGKPSVDALVGAVSGGFQGFQPPADSTVMPPLGNEHLHSRPPAPIDRPGK